MAFRTTTILLAAVLAAAAPPARAFTFAKKGVAEASVVIPADAAPYVRKAAGELAAYLGKMTGASFPVTAGAADAEAADGKGRILVGFERPFAKPEEVYVGLRNPRALDVTGEGTRGTLYAAYQLLEALGCGFWAPHNETVPSRPTLEIPGTFRLSSAPAFRFRQPMTWNAYTRRWAVKVGINGSLSGSEPCEEDGGLAHMNMDQWVTTLPCRDVQEAIGRDHPDWLAWRMDRRDRILTALCLTNKEMLDEVVRRIKADYKKANPFYTRPIYYSFSLYDDDQYCQCKNCAAVVKREGSAMGLLLHGANYIAKQIADECPDARMMVMAYWVTLPKPKHLKPERNVHVTVAMPRDYTKPPSRDKWYREHIRTWGKLSHGNVYVWDYNCNFSSMLTPTPIIDMMGPTFRDYQEMGVSGVFSQMTLSKVADFVDLRSWVFAKLMWNPGQDEWKLIDQWCDGACGAGAPQMKEWLRFSKKCIMGKAWHSCQADTRRFFDAADILKGYQLFQKALEATKGDPRANAQIRRQYVSVLTLMLTRHNFDLAKKARQARVAIPARDELISTLEAYFAEFHCDMKDENGYCEGASLARFLEKIRKGETLK